MSIDSSRIDIHVDVSSDAGTVRSRVASLAAPSPAKIVDRNRECDTSVALL
jgi:hypothetical protein